MKTIIKLIGALMVAANLHAQDNREGFNWTWEGGDGAWEDAHWTSGIDSSVGQAWLDLAPITTAFSATFFRDDTPQLKDGLMYCDPAAAPGLRVGYNIISSGGAWFHYDRSTIIEDVGVSGTWRVNRLNDIVSGTGYAADNFKAFSGINAQFDSVSGTVTVNGRKWLDSLNISGGGNNFTLASAAAGSGTLWFNYVSSGDGGRIYMNGGGYAELKDLYVTNLDPDNNTVKSRMLVTNQGSGTLAFNNVTFMGGNSVQLNNSGAGQVMTFQDVTFAAPQSDWMRIDTGHFYFYGNNIKTNDGDLQIGEGNGTQIVIAAGGMLKHQGNAPINIGRNAAGVTLDIQGLLEISDAGGVTGGSQDINIGTSNGLAYVTLSGTGQTRSHRLRVGNNTGYAVLIVNDTGAAGAMDQLFIAAGSGTGEVWVNGSGTLSAGWGVLLANNGGLATLDITDHGQVLFNHLNAGWDTQIAPSSGTAIINIGDAGYLHIYANLRGAQNNAAARAEIHVTDSGSLQVDKMLRLGEDGTGILTVSGSARVNSAGDMTIGENVGARGSVTVSDQASLLAGDFTVGKAGAQSEFTISGGYAETVGNKYTYVNQANNVAGSSGVLTISGGTLSTQGIDFGSNNTTVGTGTAILNISGGKLILRTGNGIHTGNYSDGNQADYTHTASDTQINLGGGAIESWDSWSSYMRMNLTGSGGNIKFIASNTSGALNTATLGGELSGAGGLEVKQGTLIITGTAGGVTTHTYTGQTVIDSGAALQLTSLAELTISLSALESGGWSAFAGAGTLTLDGKLNLLGFGAVSGESWRLFDTALLAGLTISDKAGFLKDFTWDGADAWTYDNDSQFVFDLTTGLLTIPEPSVWLLLGMGALTLTVLRRARR
ncbi:MAG: PEP-CTERM sorting domain-containing protein [Verrucomicrobiales bacterium]|nr:PEP-CTERM sorting domain-containing protein [Verrucomicrobiales bacterium]